ncbi:hypothetical protein LY78DRAFT_670394 [Colletotrichum sublineola]|nr:hypothetical protein LY78DRAFT_670394 [Colletotrichum sublineola]
MLFAPSELPTDFFPSFNRIQGNAPYRSPGEEELREEIEPFLHCEEVQFDFYQGWGIAAFSAPSYPGFDPRRIMELDKLLNFKKDDKDNRPKNTEIDPVHEVISEQDAAIATMTHFIRPAHRILSFFAPPHYTACRETWEANISPAERIYFSNKYQKKKKLHLRADIAYGLVRPGSDLDFGAGLPGLDGRPFASIEFKKKGYLEELVKDLMGQNPRDDHQRFSPDTMEYLKQLVGYCFAFRNKFASICDLDCMILFHFHEMTINEGSTPLDVWEQGHGGTFRFTILGPTQHALKPVCYAGFIRMAAEKTPKDWPKDA